MTRRATTLAALLLALAGSGAAMRAGGARMQRRGRRGCPRGAIEWGTVAQAKVKGGDEGIP
jgi:hypothetical protein